jgi:hypothetical protein
MQMKIARKENEKTDCFFLFNVVFCVRTEPVLGVIVERILCSSRETAQSGK